MVSSLFPTSVWYWVGRMVLIPCVIAAREASLAESQTALAWVIGEHESQTASLKKEHAKLEAECQAALESAKKVREDLEGNASAPNCPSAFMRCSCE